MSNPATCAVDLTPCRSRRPENRRFIGGTRKRSEGVAPRRSGNKKEEQQSCISKLKVDTEKCLLFMYNGEKRRRKGWERKA